MGYNLTKRISDLRRQADEDQEGRWSLLPTVFLCALILGLLCNFLLSGGNYYADEARTWQSIVDQQFADRLRWLEESPFVFAPAADQTYHSFARSITSTFSTQGPKDLDEDDAAVDMSSIWYWLNRTLASALLRVGFVVIAFWPFWLFSAIIGFFALRNSFVTKRTNDMLGVLHRGNGPFYSGIWGPLRPNNSISGTDLSCPSLACPKMEGKNSALSSKLTLLLKEYGAHNETNFELVRIILAHSTFPSWVAEENPAHEEIDPSLPVDEARASKTGFVTNEAGTLKDSSIDGLYAILEAHKRIAVYINSLEKKGVKNAALNKNFSAHVTNVKKLASGTKSELARELITALTPNRLWALGNLPAEAIASEYLATEAGKSLVYKRHEGGFVRISNYPHLQARAVIQSVAHYHQEYNGDTRLIIRQAIICSRRHGDFGRAFLPNRMPVESRALRDWLEVLYAEPAKRTEAAALVELDAHIEEIGVIWKLGFSTRIKQEKKPVELGKVQAFWKGVPFKSVVLMPLEDVVSTALQGIHSERLGRITELLSVTRAHQARISISARLPGFKRQAMEAERSGEMSDAVVQVILSQEGGKELLERWRIVRRMLTRFNWLSTRVGDDPVPLVGIINGVIKLEESNAELNFPNWVPLRQRRMVELLGRQWERIYYADAVNPDNVRIEMNNHKSQEGEGGEGKPPADLVEKTVALIGS